MPFTARTGTYLNPVIAGDHPDAGAIRVGEDYYLVHTTDHYTPGLLIWHSTDLVHWQVAGAALDRYYGAAWAPYLCDYKGLYYIYYPCNGEIFVVAANAPLGPWSKPVSLELHGIDPAHGVTPEGRRVLYLAGGVMAELSSDGLSVKHKPRKVVEPWPIPQNWQIECDCLEAPKLLYRDGYYYLNVAEGGTSGPPTSHMVLSARSRNIDGPWQWSPHNPVVHTYGKAEKWWSKGHGLALAKHPDDQSTQILYLHAMVTSKSDRALEYGRKLLAAYPNQWEILYLLGVLESRKGDYEQARVHLEHSVLLNPNYYQSQELLGTVLSGLGDLPSAKQHLDQAVALGDDQPEVEYALAQTLKRLGDTAEAQEKLRIYQQLKKTRSDAVQAAGKSEMADQAMAEGNPSRAAALYQEAIDLTPNEAILYYKLSQARDKIKDFAGEKTSLERAIQLNPNLAEAQNQMGYLTDRAGDLGKAETYFRAAIRVSPSYVVAWMNLAATLAGEEKWQDARQVLSHVTEIDPNNVQALQLGQALRDAHPDR